MSSSNVCNISHQRPPEYQSPRVAFATPPWFLPSCSVEASEVVSHARPQVQVHYWPVVLSDRQGPLVARLRDLALPARSEPEYLPWCGLDRIRPRDTSLLFVPPHPRSPPAQIVFPLRPFRRCPLPVRLCCQASWLPLLR